MTAARPTPTSLLISPRFLVILLPLLGGALVTSAPADGIQGISYTLTPSVETVRWDGDLGIEDTELYGGQLSMNFGRYLGLQGFYFLRDGVSTDLTNTGLFDIDGDALVNQNLDLRNYGVNVVMNLSTGNVVPYLNAGAGVMKFEAEDGDDSSQINFRLGGGLRFGIDRVRATVWVEDSALRMNRYQLAADTDGVPAFPDDPGSDDLRHNLTVGAGVEISLGGYRGEDLTEIDRAVAERFRSGLKGVSVPLEVFVGSLDFDDTGGLPKQNFGGVRTGIDFGRYFGLRGYFWKGLQNGLDGTAPLYSYGGEAQFNLNSGQGAIPYLLVGAGHLEFEDDYEDEFGVSPDDKSMLILGGGLAFAVSDRVRLDVAVRDYLFSERDLDDVTSTDQLTSNFAVTVGATLALGAGAPNVAEAKADAAAREAKIAERQARAREAEEARRGTDDDGDDGDGADADEAAPSSDRKLLERVEPRAGQGYHDGTQVTIPVPEHGEIYVRYGRPGGVKVESRFEGRDVTEPSAPPSDARTEGEPAGRQPEPKEEQRFDEDALRELIRGELEARQPAGEQETRQQQQQPEAEAEAEAEKKADQKQPDTYSSLTTEQQLELLERRLAERIDERVESRMKEAQSEQSAQPPTVVVQQPAPRTQAGGRDDADVSVDLDDGARFSPRTIDTVIGANVNDPEQLVVGGRLDLGPLSRDSDLNLVPELAFGLFNDATSVMATANLRYEMGDLERRGSIAPFVTFGAGLLVFADDVAGRTGQEGVINLSWGVAANVNDREFFIEHQGIDLFDLNRVLAGVRWELGR